jgi:hypothetical protein
MEKDDDEEFLRLFKTEDKRAYLEADGAQKDEIIPAYERNGYDFRDQEYGEQKSAKIAGPQIGDKEMPQLDDEKSYAHAP